jgi:hypothetical protein
MGDYSFGFQAQEQDEEMWGGSVTYKYRVEDPRLGRFFAVDPLFAKYSYNSPFAFSENRVIDSKELEGLEKLYFANQQITVNISGMTSDQIEKMVKEKGYNWDTDWYDAKAKEEVWTLKNCYNSYGDGTGTRIDKYSSQKAHDSKKKQAYFTEMDRTFLQWGSAWDGALDCHDGYKDALPIMATLLGGIFSGGTIIAAESVAATILPSISLALSADALTAGPEKNSKSILEEIAYDFRGEQGEALFKGAKMVLSLRDAAKGLMNISVTLTDGRTLNGVYDVFNNIYDITSATVEVAKSTQSKK